LNESVPGTRKQRSSRKTNKTIQNLKQSAGPQWFTDKLTMLRSAAVSNQISLRGLRAVSVRRGPTSETYADFEVRFCALPF